MSIRRVYETTIIINAALESDDTEAVITKITSYIESHGGNVEELDKWGKRQLAYDIEGRHHGYYIHVVFNIQSGEIPGLERFLVLDDTVLRHLTLLFEPELRAYRKEKSLAAGNNGDTIITSVSESAERLSSDFYSSSKNDVIALIHELPKEDAVKPVEIAPTEPVLVTEDAVEPVVESTEEKGE